MRALCRADALCRDALNPYIGYDKATEIVKEAAASGRSLREVAREARRRRADLDEALDYRKMAKPPALATFPSRGPSQVSVGASTGKEPSTDKGG